jgi:hypothetical protein
MICPVHHCELAECRMWAEIAQFPMTCGRPKFLTGTVTVIDVHHYQERILHAMFGLPKTLYGVYE